MGARELGSSLCPPLAPHSQPAAHRVTPNNLHDFSVPKFTPQKPLTITFGTCSQGVQAKAHQFRWGWAGSHATRLCPVLRDTLTISNVPKCAWQVYLLTQERCLARGQPPGGKSSQSAARLGAGAVPKSHYETLRVLSHTRRAAPQCPTDGTGARARLRTAPGQTGASNCHQAAGAAGHCESKSASMCFCGISFCLGAPCSQTAWLGAAGRERKPRSFNPSRAGRAKLLSAS